MNTKKLTDDEMKLIKEFYEKNKDSMDTFNLEFNKEFGKEADKEE